MRTSAFLLVVLSLFASACGDAAKDKNSLGLSREPTSVRGWIYDVEGAASKEAKPTEIEMARRFQIFQATSVWVENAGFVSGGVSQDGAFMFLDVPPGRNVLGFNAPGAETAQIVLQDIPGNADVFIPAVMLKPGGATVMQPDKIKVRIPGSVTAPRPTGRFAIVAGIKVPVIETPLAQMVDRREYPDPLAGTPRPIATVK